MFSQLPDAAGANYMPLECEDLIRQLQISAPTDRTSVSSTVESARKAVDFLDNDQLPWVEALMDCDNGGIKSWRERGFQPLNEDFTGMVVRRSANSYQDQPKRVINEGDTVSEKQTDDYNKLLSDSGINFVTNDIDELSRLLKVAFTLIEVSEDKTKLIYTNLARHNAAVKWNPTTRQVDELLYGTYNCADTDGTSQRFYLWKADTITTFTWDGSDGREESTETNTFGIIPIAVRYDISPPRQGFWTKPAWEMLVAANQALNLFHTEVKFGSRWQTLPSLFSSSTIPEGTIIGPDTIVELDVVGDEVPYVEYKSATAVRQSLAGFLEWLDSYKEDVAEQWGVNIKPAGEGSADSGFKLVVEEFPALELRNKRLASAEEYEKQLYGAVKVITDTEPKLGVKLTGDLDVSFPPPRLPVNDKETWEIWQGKIAMGAATVEDYWLHIEPDLTPADIEARHKRIDAAKKKPLEDAAPGFGNVGNNAE